MRKIAEVNGPMVGIILKELVRRAIINIRAERFNFEAQAKKGYGTEELNDLVTSADRAAQQTYLKSLRECFPLVGIIAEEDELKIPCTLDGHYGDAYFTIDPLDGTKAFGRRQSYGVGTMIALVHDGEVISAWVGDVNTQEVYGYRPDSAKVHRISEFDTNETLNPDGTKPLKQKYIVLRDMLHNYSELAQKLAGTGGPFKEYQSMDGSIGITMARLWKGEVGGVLLRPFYETPWDITPIIGISKKLGFKFYEVRPSGFREVELIPLKETEKREHELFIIHRDNNFEFLNHVFRL